MNVIIRTDHHLVYQDEDGIVYEQRAGEVGRVYSSLQEYYAMSNSAVGRWWQHCQSEILAPGAQVHAGLLAAARLAPQAMAAIEATEPGELVPGTPLTRERALELMAAAQATLALIETPVSEGGPTIGAVIAEYA